MIRGHLFGFLLCFALPLHGLEPIHLAQSIGVTGPAAIPSVSYAMGLQAAFDEINLNGGIGGRPIELTLLDDKYNVTIALENYRTFTQNDSVLALVGTGGTSIAAALYPLVNSERMPWVGPLTGAGFLRNYNDFHDNIINIRVAYGDEVRKQIEFMVEYFEYYSIGFLVTSNPFGDEFLVNVDSTLASYGIKKKGLVRFDDAADGVRRMRLYVDQFPRKTINAIVVVSLFQDLVTIVNTAGLSDMFPGVPIFTFTTTAFSEAEFSAAIGDRAKSLYVSVVIPLFNMSSSDGSPQKHPIAIQLENALQRMYNNSVAGYLYGERMVDPHTVEGYLLGAVVIQNLLRMDAFQVPITRDNFIDSIYSYGSFQVAELFLGPYLSDCSALSYQLPYKSMCRCNQGMHFVYIIRMKDTSQGLRWEQVYEAPIYTCNTDTTTDMETLSFGYVYDGPHGNADHILQQRKYMMGVQAGMLYLNEGGGVNRRNLKLVPYPLEMVTAESGMEYGAKELEELVAYDDVNGLMGLYSAEIFHSAAHVLNVTNSSKALLLSPQSASGAVQYGTGPVYFNASVHIRPSFAVQVKHAAEALGAQRFLVLAEAVELGYIAHYMGKYHTCCVEPLPPLTQTLPLWEKEDAITEMTGKKSVVFCDNFNTEGQTRDLYGYPPFIMSLGLVSNHSFLLHPPADISSVLDTVQAVFLHSSTPDELIKTLVSIQSHYEDGVAPPLVLLNENVDVHISAFQALSESERPHADGVYFVHFLPDPANTSDPLVSLLSATVPFLPKMEDQYNQNVSYGALEGFVNSLFLGSLLRQAPEWLQSSGQTLNALPMTVGFSLPSVSVGPFSPTCHEGATRLWLTPFAYSNATLLFDYHTHAIPIPLSLCSKLLEDFSITHKEIPLGVMLGVVAGASLTVGGVAILLFCLYIRSLRNHRLQSLLIPYETIFVGEVIGEGMFSVVLKATTQGRDVALKMVNYEIVANVTGWGWWCCRSAKDRPSVHKLYPSAHFGAGENQDSFPDDTTSIQTVQDANPQVVLTASSYSAYSKSSSHSPSRQFPSQMRMPMSNSKEMIEQDSGHMSEPKSPQFFSESSSDEDLGETTLPLRCSQGVVEFFLDEGPSESTDVRQIVQEQIPGLSLERSFLETVMWAYTLQHPNILPTLGYTVHRGRQYGVVLEYMGGGTLKECLANPTLDLEWPDRVQMALEIVEGLSYLHNQPVPVLHRRLKSANIFLDAKGTVKLGAVPHPRSRTLGYLGYAAPEVLRGQPATTATDVYALGILLWEIMTRRQPYAGIAPQDILEGVKDGLISPFVISSRQALCHNQDKSLMPIGFRTLIESCLSTIPDNRPTLRECLQRLHKLHVESKVLSDKVKQEAQSKTGNQKLLYELFPPTVADTLLQGKTVEPEPFESVSIVFSDIVGFTTISSTLPAEMVMNMLDRLYRLYDALSLEHSMFKIETIGDAYMATSGLHPRRTPQDHALAAINFALAQVHRTQDFPVMEGREDYGTLRIRVGIHTGPVVASVAGTINRRYCLFGDTVNLANKMETTSIPMHVHISITVFDALKMGFTLPQLKEKQLIFVEKKPLDIKGKGILRTFLVYHKEHLSHMESTLQVRFSTSNSVCTSNPTTPLLLPESPSMGLRSPILAAAVPNKSIALRDSDEEKSSIDLLLQKNNIF